MNPDRLTVERRSEGVAGGVEILGLRGLVDTTTAHQVEKVFQSLAREKAFRVLVDLSGVTYVSSAGWGVFVGEIRGFRKNGGDIKLAGMNADVLEVFELLELNSILETFPDNRSALEAIEREASGSTATL
jgi:anti-sigma B factor antagonist